MTENGRLGSAVPSMTSEKIYPLLVPSSWFQDMAGYRGPFGQGVEMTLVDAGKDFLRSVTAEETAALGGEEPLFAAALGNLEDLAARREVGMRLFPTGPQERPFLLFGGHWSAATCLLLPGLYALASRALGTGPLCASIPHRGTMILFPEGDAAYRAAMRQLILEKEGNKERPLTLDLFSLRETGVAEFHETPEPSP